MIEAEPREIVSFASADVVPYFTDEEAKFRLMMFKCGFEHLFKSHKNHVVRFGMALAYSFQEFTDEERQRMQGWEERLAVIRAEYNKKVYGDKRLIPSEQQIQANAERVEREEREWEREQHDRGNEPQRRRPKRTASKARMPRVAKSGTRAA